MLSYQGLKNFITETMRMSHLYQPVIIKTLLESGGKATIESLAERLFSYMPESDYPQKLKGDPKDVLSKHGIAHLEGDQYALNLVPSSLTTEQLEELIELCAQKIRGYLENKVNPNPLERRIQWSKIQSREPILLAIEEYDLLGRDSFLKKYGFGRSRYYLSYEDQLYDIKALAAAAWRFAFPEQGAPQNNEFSSGEPVITLFERLGFQIIKTNQDQGPEEEHFFPILQKFLLQAQQEPINLKKSDYSKSFHGFQLEVSFGKGNAARIPWIAFLKNTQLVTDGIYPVYLFYKAQNILILSYGLSETHKPKLSWNISEDAATIKSYFQNNFQQNPERYGNSYIFKTYDLSKPLLEEQMNDDLLEILGEYNDALSQQDGHLKEPSPAPSQVDWAERVRDFIIENQLDFEIRERKGGISVFGAKGRLFKIRGHFLEWNGVNNDQELETLGCTLYEPKTHGNVRAYGRFSQQILDFLESWLKALNNSSFPIQPIMAPMALNSAILQLIQSISAGGFYFEPWQIANFITALKTKPFAILAGISGTGKSKLPTLIGNYTGAEVHLIPVKPDWTDSSELIGYQNLQDQYVFGRLLSIAATAQDEPHKTHICILDEMNLARVEQYFAEVLSLIEDRRLTEDGYYSHFELTKHVPEVFLPANLLIVGTVNMDETTHGFSKKVLDRAFTLEMSEVKLEQWRSNGPQRLEEAFWHHSLWQPKCLRLSELQDLKPEEEAIITQTIQLLLEVNQHLMPAQLQVGYRVRDEICLYLLHAHSLQEHFVTTEGESVLALDLAFLMKILPRIQGSSLVIGEVLRNLISWSAHIKLDEIDEALTKWKKNNRPQVILNARFPRTCARLMIMYERFKSEGFTSYWL